MKACEVKACLLVCANTQLQSLSYLYILNAIYVLSANFIFLEN